MPVCTSTWNKKARMSSLPPRGQQVFHQRWIWGIHWLSKPGQRHQNRGINVPPFFKKVVRICLFACPSVTFALIGCWGVTSCCFRRQDDNDVGRRSGWEREGDWWVGAVKTDLYVTFFSPFLSAAPLIFLTFVTSCANNMKGMHWIHLKMLGQTVQKTVRVNSIHARLPTSNIWIVQYISTLINHTRTQCFTWLILCIHLLMDHQRALMMQNTMIMKMHPIITAFDLPELLYFISIYNYWTIHPSHDHWFHTTNRVIFALILSINP